MKWTCCQITIIGLMVPKSSSLWQPSDVRRSGSCQSLWPPFLPCPAGPFLLQWQWITCIFHRHHKVLQLFAFTPRVPATWNCPPWTIRALTTSYNDHVMLLTIQRDCLYHINLQLCSTWQRFSVDVYSMNQCIGDWMSSWMLCKHLKFSLAYPNL